MTARRRKLTETLTKHHDAVEQIVGACICHDDWVACGLAQHDCAWCDHAEEVAELVAILAELKPWAEKLLKRCRSGDPIRHTALDGCGPAVMSDRCEHGVLRYGEMAEMVLDWCKEKKEVTDG